MLYFAQATLSLLSSLTSKVYKEGKGTIVAVRHHHRPSRPRPSTSNSWRENWRKQVARDNVIVLAEIFFDSPSPDIHTWRVGVSKFFGSSFTLSIAGYTFKTLKGANAYIFLKSIYTTPDTEDYFHVGIPLNNPERVAIYNDQGILLIKVCTNSGTEKDFPLINLLCLTTEGRYILLPPPFKRVKNCPSCGQKFRGKYPGQAKGECPACALRYREDEVEQVKKEALGDI